MSDGPSGRGQSKGLLTDVTKCIGCHLCVEACVAHFKLPPDLPFRTSQDDGLSGRRLTSVLQVPGTARTVRKHCLHCLEPSCAAACPVGALVKRADGPVIYDPGKCIGCRYCLLACPFNVPRLEWDRPVPYVRKCRMNEDCVAAGEVPACVAACPTGATIYGDREELIATARARIAAHPQLYVNKIWGERDLGGTAVIYLSDVDLSEILGFPRDRELAKNSAFLLRDRGLPELVRPGLTFTPVGAGLVFGGLWGVWLIRRRQRLMPDGGEAPPGGGGEDRA